MVEAGTIAAAFIAACRDELAAPKPGNVHVFAEGHGMTAGDFVASATAAAPFLAALGASVGARIDGAVAATWAAVGQNTNLGIVLLCAPLAAAAERGGPLTATLGHVLAGLKVDDAALAFRAILRASPAGLGHADTHDVRAPPIGTLLQAMQAAAQRDSIARQYASNYADIFDLGIPALHASRQSGAEGFWPTLTVYLHFLAAFPDSHIVRKFGVIQASVVQAQAADFANRCGRQAGSPAFLDEILAFDQQLKASGLNPGTSADLTVATLFADRLARL